MKYIVIDLELEQPNTNRDAPDSKIDYEKIIQVGASVIDIKEEESIIVETVGWFLKYDQPLSTFIKKLTGITDGQVNQSTLTAADAVNELIVLREKHGAERILLEWGSGDVSALFKEAQMSPNDSGFGRSGLNVKHLHRLFCQANGISAGGGLGKSMGKLGLQFQSLKIDGKNKGAHDARVDAYNTARIFDYLFSQLVKR